MNFRDLYRKIEAIDKGQSLDEFLGFGKKKEQPAPGQPAQPGQSGQPAQPGQSGQPAQPGNAATTAVTGNSGALGNAARSLAGRGRNIDAAVDAAVKEEDDEETCSVKEEVVDECGMMGGLPPPMEAPKQQDSVTMNVSMNGSGSGGIRDLLNVLKDIQDGPDNSSDDMDIAMGVDIDSDSEAGPDVLLKKNIDSMASAIDDDFANSAPGADGPKIGGLDMVTHDGDDLHKQKAAYPKASGGDNAMKLKDGATFKMPAGEIKVKLESLYQEILKREAELTEGVKAKAVESGKKLPVKRKAK